MISRKHFTWLGLLLLGALVLYVGCSDSDDPVGSGNPVTTETIGTTGGEIEIADAVTMTVPAGAVDADVNFTMNQANNPAGMVSVRALGSAVYSIGPSGTTFNTPVTLELHYDEADLGGIAESAIVIYTNDGSGWAPLPTTVDEVNNIATAEIYHLSDFAVTTPSGEAADGVFAVFEIVRLLDYNGATSRIDMITARFDSVVNPCDPVAPQHPDSVYCNAYPMEWDEMFLTYVDQNGVDAFLTLGAEYTYHVLASDDVPALTQSIDMVEHEPAFTNIAGGLLDTPVLSKQGFTAEWNDTSDDSVTVALVRCDEQVVVKRQLNNGSAAFSAEDLEDVEPGLYALVLINYTKTFITDVPGYDPNSYILAGTDDTQIVSISDEENLVGEGGGIVLLGMDGRLIIAPGALDENVAFTAEINTAPTTTDDYTFLTPVYTLGPDGTQFDGDGATLRFYYNQNDLGDVDEDEVVILRDSGSGWEELDTFIWNDENWAEADLDHLSDYVCAFPVPHVTEGVYMELEVSRNHSVEIGMPDIVIDWLKLRFDETAGDDPVTPLEAGTATFGAWSMDWWGDESDDDYYFYEDMDDFHFLTVGNEYSLVVTGSDDVSPIALQVPFPSAPAISNIQPGDELSIEGFTLEWDDHQSGTEVFIWLSGGDGTGYSVTAPNTGSYTFTAAELSGINPDPAFGTPQISITLDVDVPIVEDGFDSASHVNYFTMSIASGVDFVTGTVEPVTVTYASTPSLAIPYGSTATDVINVPVTGTVQSIRVYHDVSASWMSDQTTVLYAPGGVNCKVLWVASGGETDGHYSGWYPTDYDPGEYGDDTDFDPFIGESINGNWTLHCRDYSSGADDGVLNEWRIEITYLP